MCVFVQLNEMSVVQNNQNGIGGAGKYSGLLGFGYPPPESLRAQGACSPDRSERPSSREPESRSLWDLHFDRKSAPEAPREDLLPASREGLAAWDLIKGCHVPISTSLIMDRGNAYCDTSAVGAARTANNTAVFS